MSSDLQRVTFEGGRMAGAVILMSPRLAAGIDARTLSVTPAGKVYDRRRQRYVEAQVVELPTAQRPGSGS